MRANTNKLRNQGSKDEIIPINEADSKRERTKRNPNSRGMYKGQFLIDYTKCDLI
jgi:hypothetical protein